MEETNDPIMTQTQAGIFLTAVGVIAALVLFFIIRDERRVGAGRFNAWVRRAKRWAWIGGGGLVGSLALACLGSILFRSPSKLTEVRAAFQGNTEPFEYDVSSVRPGGAFPENPKILFLEWENPSPEKKLPDSLADFRKSVTLRLIPQDVIA